MSNSSGSTCSRPVFSSLGHCATHQHGSPAVKKQGREEETIPGIVSALDTYAEPKAADSYRDMRPAALLGEAGIILLVGGLPMVGAEPGRCGEVVCPSGAGELLWR